LLHSICNKIYAYPLTRRIHDAIIRAHSPHGATEIQHVGLLLSATRFVAEQTRDILGIRTKERMKAFMRGVFLLVFPLALVAICGAGDPGGQNANLPSTKPIYVAVNQDLAYSFLNRVGFLQASGTQLMNLTSVNTGASAFRADSLKPSG
jgi:hypothetical protein